MEWSLMGEIVAGNHTYDVNNLDESDVNIEWDSTGTTIAFGDSVYYYFQAVTGMNNLVAQQVSLNVYPNPAANYITVESNSIAEDQTISVYNIQGQLITQQKILQAKTNIDISAFEKGIYVVKVNNAKGLEVRKFVKE